MNSLFKTGLNIVGYFNRMNGLGESARLFVKSLESCRIPYEIISVDPESLAFVTPPKWIHPINLFYIDQGDLVLLITNIGWKTIRNHYNIGNLFWETNILTKNRILISDYLDEVWVSSRYIQEHASLALRIPVYNIRHPLQLMHQPSMVDKKIFGISDKYTFLFCFDFRSTPRRKNPDGVIHAFQKAFAKSQDVQLVIKSQNGRSHWPRQFYSYLSDIKHDPRIKWIDESMTSEKRYELMNACDCYVSLHRSEGLGLTMGEAMLLEKPVIGTGYSGNLDFMNEDNSYLCSYTFTSVGKGQRPYPSHGKWADPDIDQAAYWMEYVFKNRDSAKEKAKKGKQFVQQYHSFEYVGEQIERRINKIQLPEAPKALPANYLKHKFWFCCVVKSYRNLKNLVKNIIPSSLLQYIKR